MSRFLWKGKMRNIQYRHLKDMIIKLIERIKKLILKTYTQNIDEAKIEKINVMHELDGIVDVPEYNDDDVRNSSLEQCNEQIAIIESKIAKFKDLKMRLSEERPIETAQELANQIECVDKLERNIIDLDIMCMAYKMRKHNIEGFRIKELEHLLKEYACEETTFWKFSQSKAGIAGEKGVFAEYIPGNIVESMDKDSGISFVRARDLYKCWQYGDQITRFVFDLNNPKFKEIADKPAYETGNALGEIKTDYLLPDVNYSLSEPKTIVEIIKLSDKSVVSPVTTFFANRKFKEQMERFGFVETVAFIDYVNVQLNENRNQYQWVRDNIDDLLRDFEKLKRHI